MQIVGFSREITLIDYGITNDPEKFVTEICIPVKCDWLSTPPIDRAEGEGVSCPKGKKMAWINKDDWSYDETGRLYFSEFDMKS